MDDLVQVGTDNFGHVIEKTTRKLREEKHPKGQEPPPQTLIPDPPESEHLHDAIIFEMITGELIRHAALHTQGAAGPSGVDVYAWRRLCSSFKNASNDLCNALAAVACRLCTSNVHPDSVMAFVACRLIPLNKNPWVRPIGIGEVPRRISDTQNNW